MSKGVRIWACDACGKIETWRKGWRYFIGVESGANKLAPRADGEPLLLPWSVCSDSCEDASFAAWASMASAHKIIPEEGGN